jgi:tRNA(His) 5'-end guanylyltransferase
MRSPLMYPPSFDGRISLFPSEENVQDYLKWRQSDCKLKPFVRLIHTTVHSDSNLVLRICIQPLDHPSF